MKRLVFLESADLDLANIFLKSQLMWGDQRARKTIVELKRVADTLCTHPRLGLPTSKEDIFSRSVSKLPFVLLYQITEEEIKITQVLHDKRNRL